jgi:uncharacterized protein (DUF58 family)
MAESLLDNAFLARLEYLYVVTRELFFGHVSAERQSRKFGVGLEFADYRAYTPGDDFRYIDWLAYARRDDLLIKLFTEEQAARIYCVIDASASMAVGEPEKLLYAKKIAAALGYIGLSNLDAVTIVVFDEQLREGSRALQGRGQLAHMMSYLEGIEPRGRGTAMGTALQQFVRRYKGGAGIVVLLSDFLDRQGYEEALRLLHYHHFDVIAVQVNERNEVDPGYSGDLELIDSENGERKVVQMTPQLLDAYRGAFQEHYAELARLCKALRRGYVPVVSDVPFENVIFDVFRRGGFLR